MIDPNVALAISSVIGVILAVVLVCFFITAFTLIWVTWMIKETVEIIRIIVVLRSIYKENKEFRLAD